MNVQSIIHRPDVVVPDATVDNVSPSQLTDAVNVRLSKFTASSGRNVGVRTITGNELVPNPYLPDGDNFAVGTCSDNVEGRIFFANWNSNGNHGIYVINTNTATGQEEIEPVLKWSGLEFRKDDYVSMAYNRGFIIWCCPTTEPRYVDVQKAINTEVFLATGVAPGETLTLDASGRYSTYNFDQIRQPPLGAGQFRYTNINVSEVLRQFSETTAKRPIKYVTLNGYQFAYNFVFQDYSESRLSQPSNASFGIIPEGAPVSLNGIEHIIFVDLFDRFFIFTYKQVRAIKWYIRESNVGEWVWFSETELDDSVFNDGSGYNITIPNFTGPNSINLRTYGIQLPRIDKLTSIGPLSPAAALAVDGIAKRVTDNIFADNRIIHAGLQIGDNLQMPSAVLSTRQMSAYEINTGSEYRIFAPVRRKKRFAYVFYDAKGRIIGTKRIGEIDAPVAPGVFIDLKQFLTADSNYFKYLNNLNNAWATADSEWRNALDVNNVCIDIQPNALTVQELQSFDDAGIERIGLAAQDEFDIPFFIRCQSRTYWVYKDENDKFIYAISNLAGMASDDWTGKLEFYGMGFQIPSNFPVNFSLDQNYHISIRGITDHNNYASPVNTEIFLEKEFKITALDKTILISEQNFTQAGVSIPSTGINVVYANIIGGLTNTGADDSFLENWWENVFGSDDKRVFTGWQFDFSSRGFYQWSQTIADIVIYSKNSNSNRQYKIIPNISWRPLELSNNISQSKRSYYGDAYKITNSQTINSPTVVDLYFYTSGYAADLVKPGVAKIPNYAVGKNGTGLGQMTSSFVMASTSFAGMTDVEYTQDIGDVVAENQKPVRLNQSRLYAHGEQFIEGTRLNNWFLFNPENRRSVSGNVGNIVRVLNQSLTTNQGENIYIYCTQGVEMVYLGKVQQVGTDGTGVLSLSTNIFGTTNVMRLPYGPKNPRHVTQTTLGMAYYFDSGNRVLVQVSASGQDSVSEQRKFQTDTRRIGIDAVIGYDPFTSEVTLIDSAGEGLAYNILEEKYQGRRKMPKNDLLTFIASEAHPKTMYGFYNGEIYRFLNDAPSSKIITVNGSPIIQSIKFVANHELNKHKVFSFIRLLCEYNNGSDKIDWTAIIDGFNQGQLGVSLPVGTTITPAEFVKRNYFYQATIKANENVDLYDGPLITGPFAEITLLGDEKYKNLIFAEIGYTLPPAQ